MSHEKAVGYEKFEYDTGEGIIYLPNMKRLKSGVLRKIRNLTDADQMYTLFELVLTDDQLALLDELDGDELEVLVKEWNEFSGVSLGESAASSS